MATSDPEALWGALLSRAPGQIEQAWNALTGEERLAVFSHLKRMASEEGWTEPQRLSAQAALDVLGDLADRAAED